MHDAIRHRILAAWSDLTTTRPWLVLSIAFVLTAICIVLTATKLGFESNRNELISHDLPWNQRFIDWTKNFDGTYDLVVVVDSHNDGSPQGTQRLATAKAFVAELGATLAADSDHVHRAIWQATFTPRALRLAPMPEFKSRIDQIAQADTLLQSSSPASFFLRILKQMQGHSDITPEQATEQIRSLSTIVTGFGTALSAPDDKPLNLATLVTTPEQRDEQTSLLISPNNRLLFIRVTPRLRPEELNAQEKALAGIRAHVVKLLSRHPGLDAGVTGIEVIEADETTVAERDSTLASIASTILITLVLVAAYHSWRMPLLATISLLVGVAWAFGFTTLAIGYLQVLSVVFTIMLLGLGIAYAIHLASRYEVVRHSYPDTPQGFTDAMRNCFQAMGPGIITGALTTAASFMTTVFTKFTGVAEMGLIAGVGILLCLLSIFAVFPALLRVFKWQHRHVVPLEQRNVRFFHESWFLPFSRHPWATIVIAAIITVVSALPMSLGKMPFDYDLMNLQPRGVPSIEWSKRIVSDGGQSIWSGVSVCKNLDEARQRAALFLKQPHVESVGGVGLLFPADEAQKVALIQQTREQLSASLSPTTTTTAPSVASPDLSFAITTMRFAMQIAGRTEMPDAVRAELTNLDKALAQTQTTLNSLDASVRPARVARLNDAFDQWRTQVKAQVTSALDPSPLTLDDLPKEIIGPYLGKDGTVALEVYPKLPRDASPAIDSPLDPRFLPWFIGDMRVVDPLVTGVIVQIYESGSLIKWSYIHAGFWALLIVFVFVYFDFRSLLETVMAIVPVFIAFATTFGLMWALGMKINAANIMVLPLLFGIGVDSGVHMLYRYRQNPSERPIGLTVGTGKGITITTLTSIVGFGTMVFASHRGIASLGFVLSAGLLMTLLACLTVMPAWLELRRRRVESADASR
jgi:hopanoid biosynthesis associated RND transporter like protein HpnN